MFSKPARLLCIIVSHVLPESIRDRFCLCPDEPAPISEDFPADFKFILDRLAFNDEAKVEEALSFCKDIFERENSRGEAIENKATILAGFSGTAAAAIIAILALFFQSSEGLSKGPVIYLSLVFLFLIILTLVISIKFSLRVIAIRAYRHPDPNTIFKLSNKSVEEVKKRRAASYFESYAHNQYTNSRKVDAFRCARSYFGLAMCLTILVMLLLCIYIAFGDITLTGMQTSRTPSVIFTPTLTLSAIATPNPLLDPIPTMTPLRSTVAPYGTETPVEQWTIQPTATTDQ